MFLEFSISTGKYVKKWFKKVFRRFLLVPVVSYWCPSFLIGARRFLLVPVVSYWCMSTFSSRDLFFFTYSNEDFEIVSYIYNPPKVRKSWWSEFDLCNPPQRNTLVFRRFLLVPVVSYWCPSFLIRARRFLFVPVVSYWCMSTSWKMKKCSCTNKKRRAPIRNDGHE